MSLKQSWRNINIGNSYKTLKNGLITHLCLSSHSNFTFNYQKVICLKAVSKHAQKNKRDELCIKTWFEGGSRWGLLSSYGDFKTILKNMT